MAKRNLNPGVPETPFLAKNTLDKANVTPLLKGGIIIQKAQPHRVVQMNGISIMKPGGPVVAKSKLPEIPLFKGPSQKMGPPVSGGLPGKLGGGGL